MNKVNLLYERESYLIRGACFDLYKELGCVHKEVVYQRTLFNKLVKNNLNTQKEVRLPVKADGQIVGIYNPDFVINNSIIIETKAKNFITQEDKKQFWHYLKTTDFKLGFLINFGKPGGVEIVRRVYDTARDKVPRVSA